MPERAEREPYSTAGGLATSVVYENAGKKRRSFRYGFTRRIAFVDRRFGASTYWSGTTGTTK